MTIQGYQYTVMPPHVGDNVVAMARACVRIGTTTKDPVLLGNTATRAQLAVHNNGVNDIRSAPSRPTLDSSRSAVQRRNAAVKS